MITLQVVGVCAVIATVGGILFVTMRDTNKNDDKMGIDYKNKKS